MILKSGFYLHTGWQHVYKEEEKELCDSNVSREVIIQYLHTRTHTQPPPHTYTRTHARTHTCSSLLLHLLSFKKKKRRISFLKKKVNVSTEVQCVLLALVHIFAFLARTQILCQPLFRKNREVSEKNFPIRVGKC